MREENEKKLRKIYEVFKLAIESEKQAQKMYESALKNSCEKDHKMLFSWLLREERIHEKRLVNRYIKLRKRLTG